MERLQGGSQHINKRSGLVFGEVQSGKTTSMQTLLALALDSGYKFVLLLSGRTVILRDQTEKRIRMRVRFVSFFKLKMNFFQGRRRSRIRRRTERFFF